MDVISDAISFGFQLKPKWCNLHFTLSLTSCKIVTIMKTVLHKSCKCNEEYFRTTVRYSSVSAICKVGDILTTLFSN